MKEIEKLLDRSARGGNNASPLILDSVKERIQTEPNEAESVKKAKVAYGVRITLNAVLRACCALILCFTAFLVIPLFMPAGASNPDFNNGTGENNYPVPPSHLSALTEKVCDIESAEKISAQAGLSFMYVPEGDYEFYCLEYKDITAAFKTVLKKDGQTVTVIQTVNCPTIYDYDLMMHGNNFYRSYDVSLPDGISLSLSAHRTEDGFVCEMYADGPVKIYLITDSDAPEALEQAVKEMQSRLTELNDET